MIYLADTKTCTGCSACFNICPKQAIDMKPDKEGFLQPFINQEKCIECGLCTKRCPVINPINIDCLKQEAYALISTQDRNVSSSGGAFSVFARYVLSKKGSVYGAFMNEKLHTHHIRIEDIKDLHLLRGSKYVQSEIGNCFQLVKKDLANKQMVLFTGTPCQIAGLYKYLGGKYEHLLITLDLVCHGVPSPLAFKSYIEKLEDAHPSYGHIIEFKFRKFDSWSIIPSIKFEHKELNSLDQADNCYMKSFFRGWIYRECCFNCHYSNLQRIGTFTIADFWGIGKHGTKFNKNITKGVSLVIDNNQQFPNIFKDLQTLAYIEKRDIKEACYENHNLKFPVKREKERDSALIDLIDTDISLQEYAKKYQLLKAENIFYYLKKYSKYAIHTLGLYNIYKLFIYKMK